MSPREQIQNQIYEYLEVNREKFDAPYGVICSLETIRGGPGKARTITFGIARWLDCTFTIWSPERISVDAQGSASQHLKRLYHSVTELLTDLEKL